MSVDVDDALAALDGCEAAAAKLHKMCCEPDRSPRLGSISDRLLEVRTAVVAASSDHEVIGPTLDMLEQIGGDVGQLQVACCAPVRMPHYARLLSGLSSVQVSLNRMRGLGH